MLIAGGLVFSIQLWSLLPGYAAGITCLFVIYLHSGLRAYQNEVATMRRHLATVNQRLSTTMQKVQDLETPINEVSDGLRDVERTIGNNRYPSIDNYQNTMQSTYENLDKLTASVGSINTKLSLIAPDATVGATSALTMFKKLRRPGPVLLIMSPDRADALDAVAAGGLPDDFLVLAMNHDGRVQEWPSPHSLGGVLIALDDVPLDTLKVPVRFWRWLRTDIPILSYVDNPARLTSSAEKFAALSRDELIVTQLTSRTAAFARSFDVQG